MPLSELGFKAKIYYGIETEYTRKRVKYKAARYWLHNLGMGRRIVSNALWADLASSSILLLSPMISWKTLQISKASANTNGKRSSK